MPKIRIYANFEYKSISFKSFSHSGHNYETYEIGFIFNDDRHAELQFLLKNEDIKLLELEVKKNSDGDLFFSNNYNFSDINVFV